MRRGGFVFLIILVSSGAIFASWWLPGAAQAGALPGGTLDPASIPKYQDPLVILPAQRPVVRNPFFTIYSIVAKQFEQQILPSGYPATTVWGYGSSLDSVPGSPGYSLHYPGFTIEVRSNERVLVDWINGLLDENNYFLPHLLPVRPAIPWASPSGLSGSRLASSQLPAPYQGPVPLVTHVHGARVSPASNGYPEAWYLPHADNIPSGLHRRGSRYETVAAVSQGHALYEYNNSQRGAALWYHDNALGIADLNVYAGLAGFWLIRDEEEARLGLPGPAPSVDDPSDTRYFEIPLMIQDRSFNTDGSLFFPDQSATGGAPGLGGLQVPIVTGNGSEDQGNVASATSFPYPEFYGNVMVVNGRSWPYLEVEPKRYRFRLLNACGARFLKLRFSESDLGFLQIGTDGGLMEEPVELSEILLAPGERADVIVDFSGLSPNSRVILRNVGPDGPIKSAAGTSRTRSADPGTTGKVMQFRVIASSGEDTSTTRDALELPAFEELGPEQATRQVSLIEHGSETVLLSDDRFGDVESGEMGLTFDQVAGRPGQVGVSDKEGSQIRTDGVEKALVLHSAETWEIYNWTDQARPVHLNLAELMVINRQPFDGEASNPRNSEKGFKDTIIAYPGEITRIKVHSGTAGPYGKRDGSLDLANNQVIQSYELIGDELAWPDDSSSPLRSLLRSLKWTR